MFLKCQNRKFIIVFSVKLHLICYSQDKSNIYYFAIYYYITLPFNILYLTKHYYITFYHAYISFLRHIYAFLILSFLSCLDILIAYKLVGSLSERAVVDKYLVFVFGLVEIAFAWLWQDSRTVKAGCDIAV